MFCGAAPSPPEPGTTLERRTPLKMRKSVTLTLTLPKDLLCELNTRSKEQDLNRSQLIRKAIRAHQLRLSVQKTK